MANISCRLSQQLAPYNPAMSTLIASFRDDLSRSPLCLLRPMTTILTWRSLLIYVRTPFCFRIGHRRCDSYFFLFVVVNHFFKYMKGDRITKPNQRSLFYLLLERRFISSVTYKIRNNWRWVSRSFVLWLVSYFLDISILSTTIK